MNNELPILLRPANKDDIGFIFNSWLKSYKSSKFTEQIPNEIYYAEHHKIIENLLQQYNVIIAANQEDPNQLYGFICAGLTDGIFTLHYLYVKHTFRRMGIANSLLNAFEHNSDYAAIYTHKTRSATSLAEKYNFIYHPYVALNPDAYNKKDKK
jgi:ribosomal protein S18 acetylase RimI-like enzyme